jgi:hypothetical protein
MTGTNSQSGRSEKKNTWFPAGIRHLDLPARSLVNIPNILAPNITDMWNENWWTLLEITSQDLVLVVFQSTSYTPYLNDLMVLTHKVHGRTVGY